ncbi:ABC transporter substrate-binding protein [Lederbergia wuyishanensis]|uniref:Multiple sugar transport system substrate-binding protein n=1 Tax=Lederbergia wuyishanensis TaxID=1347903 RepID=A0ABU0D9M7_9BACI|nr:sugar ABC transporter substrate-binding protein [Lederbergia wuyishanensis]MCJ8007438.1 sugar ABC transporter substrate-binding protein [Lederbergia wuyishanensis]MDQ0345124.1 multiple sugar transport system substrate-binding protein [Lederbergia wuyishanensis]
MPKKIWILILTSILCIFITACSSDNSSKNSDGKSDGEKVTLKFMYWGSVFEKQAVEKMVKSFEEKNPNIKIDAQHVPNDYGTKINTLMASGDLPDVAYLGEGLALKWAEEGKVMDVTQYMLEYDELKNRIPETFYYFDKGKTIGTNTAGEIMSLFYNKDLFAEQGVDLPPADAQNAWDWASFVETAQKLTLDNQGRNALSPDFDAKNIAQYGISFPTWWAGWYPFLLSNGGAITNEDGTKYTLNSPEAVEVFQNLQDLMYKYHVAPTPTQKENMPATSVLLQTKKVAMVIDGHWNILDFGESKLNYGIGVLPKYKEAKSVIFGAPTVIFADTKHPDEAMKFYLFHNNPEEVDLFAKGLWMPLEEKYYTEQEYIDSWTNNEVHPPEFKEAVVDYTMNNIEPGPSYSLKNFVEIDPAIGAGLDPIWLGKKSAKDALDELEKSVQPLLQGLYER